MHLSMITTSFEHHPNHYIFTKRMIIGVSPPPGWFALYGDECLLLIQLKVLTDLFYFGCCDIVGTSIHHN
jgi:hypothetical protein